MTDFGHTAGIYGNRTRVNSGQRRSPPVSCKSLQSLGFRAKSLERATRIELAFSTWELDTIHPMLAVNQQMVTSSCVNSKHHSPRGLRRLQYLDGPQVPGGRTTRRIDCNWRSPRVSRPLLQQPGLQRKVVLVVIALLTTVAIAEGDALCNANYNGHCKDQQCQE